MGYLLVRTAPAAAEDEPFSQQRRVCRDVGDGRDASRRHDPQEPARPLPSRFWRLAINVLVVPLLVLAHDVAVAGSTVRRAIRHLDRPLHTGLGLGVDA